LQQKFSCNSLFLRFDSKAFYVTVVNVTHHFLFSLYLKGCGKMAYSKNANMSLKQHDLSHITSGLAYHWRQEVRWWTFSPILCIYG